MGTDTKSDRQENMLVLSLGPADAPLASTGSFLKGEGEMNFIWLNYKKYLSITILICMFCLNTGWKNILKKGKEKSQLYLARKIWS